MAETDVTAQSADITTALSHLHKGIETAFEADNEHQVRVLVAPTAETLEAAQEAAKKLADGEYSWLQEVLPQSETPEPPKRYGQALSLYPSPTDNLDLEIITDHIEMIKNNIKFIMKENEKSRAIVVVSGEYMVTGESDTPQTKHLTFTVHV